MLRGQWIQKSKLTIWSKNFYNLHKIFISKCWRKIHRRQSGVTSFTSVLLVENVYGMKLTFENALLFDLRAYYRANLQPKDVESRVPFCHNWFMEEAVGCVDGASRGISGFAGTQQGLGHTLELPFSFFFSRSLSVFFIARDSARYRWSSYRTRFTRLKFRVITERRTRFPDAPTRADEREKVRRLAGEKLQILSFRTLNFLHFFLAFSSYLSFFWHDKSFQALCTLGINFSFDFSSFCLLWETEKPPGKAIYILISKHFSSRFPFAIRALWRIIFFHCYSSFLKSFLV